jgi:high-affinity nickel permease
MKYAWLLLAVTLTAGSAMADEIEMSTPMAATTLRFSDRYASAFYTVDQGHFNVVVAFSAGPDERAQLIRQTFQLEDGQSYHLSIGGYASNLQATRISITRQSDHLLADVTTCESRKNMANCI